MSEYNLDGLVDQFTVVLTAMTESESLLRDQVRRVRLGAQGHPSVADVAPSSPAPFPTESVISEPAPISDGDVHTAQDSDAAPAWASTPSPVSRPEFSERPEFSQAESASPTTGHRNYDYFSELDEKLTGLRQRYLE
jgi:hypothetical protein